MDRFPGRLKVDRFSSEKLVLYCTYIQYNLTRWIFTCSQARLFEPCLALNNKIG